jgi:hypothetical protein
MEFSLKDTQEVIHFCEHFFGAIETYEKADVMDMIEVQYFSFFKML